MKGILLAGGQGTRLFPTTKGISKHLIPIYDKPMIYYPLSVLMLSGIKDILLISTPEDTESYKRLLGDGKRFGINLTYAVQSKPEGLAQAFLIGEDFIGYDSVSLVLGDNIFYGLGLVSMLEKAARLTKGAAIFGYRVKDPENFGVVEVNEDNKVISIEEKPKKPKSNIAIIGLYYFDNDVIQFAKKVIPSERGELEITSIHNAYVDQDKLNLVLLGRGFAWLDTGTPANLSSASNFVENIQLRQGFKIACLEEIGLSNGWLDVKDLQRDILKMGKSDYVDYLNQVVKDYCL